MLSISAPMKGAGCGNYYLKLAREDYYGAEQPGTWFGHGADLMQLAGTVKKSALHHLLEGRSPDGKQAWVQNAGDPHRQSAWDLTFSAPKSVSVYWALAPEDLRLQVEQAHQ
jgi:conjugative relaxase-like TrwC/TraI family protein